MKKKLLFFFSKLKVEFTYLFLTLFISGHVSENTKSEHSIINIITYGEGKDIYFMNEGFYLNPSEVIVNGEVKGNRIKKFHFEHEVNNVTIKFDEPINSFEKMFKDLTNIIEVDLSYVDSSKIKSMASMFNGCSNLKKINFCNLNTSSVENMAELFHGCKKLTSIDVSNFDTSSVTSLNSTFRNCESLKSINVTNFNT